MRFNTVTFGSPVNTTNQANVYQVTYGTQIPTGGTLSDPGVTTGQGNGANRINATSEINSSTQTTCDQVTVTTAHEIGHTLGLGDCTQCSGPLQSVMFGRIPPFSVPPYQVGPTGCDNVAVSTVYPPPSIPGCQTDCPPNSRTCVPCGQSPIILDLNGQGFHLTSAADGVMFDMAGGGNPVQIGWIAAGADNAFLALPGPDGLVHNGKQLFGNFTPQPPSDAPNGFAALAVYDDPQNGGNGDHIIDSQDAIFTSLRLWIDANHDGISQPEELHTLPSLGVQSISIDYRDSRRRDKFGNFFRYRAKVNSEDPDVSPVARTAYDVFFVQLSPIGKNAPCPAPNTEVKVVATAGGTI